MPYEILALHQSSGTSSKSVYVWPPGSTSTRLTEITQSAKSMRKRTGTNTPKFNYVVSKVGMFPQMRKQRHLAGHRMVPVKRYRWVKTGKGKPYRQSYIGYKRVPFYVTTAVPVMKKLKVQDPSFVLAPNALNYETFDSFVAPLSSKLTVKTNWYGSLQATSEVEMTGHRQFTVGNSSLSPAMPLGDANLMPDILGLSVVPWDDRFPALDEKVLFKLYEKVKDEFPNFAASLAESPETVRLVKDIVKFGIRLVRDLKRMDIKRLKGTLDVSVQDIASLFLAYTYGVAPLLGDLQKTLELAGRENRTWRSYKAYEEIVDPLTSRARYPDSAVGDYPYSGLFGTRQRLKKISVRYGVIMESTLTPAKILRKTGFTAPLGVVWEVVPFSFMVDWLYDLGGYLNSSDAMDDSVLYMWKTYAQKSHSFTDFIWRSQPPVAGWQHVITGPKTQIVNDSFKLQRFVITDVPPMPKPKWAGFGDGLTARRQINALAIFTVLNDAFKRR